MTSDEERVRSAEARCQEAIDEAERLRLRLDEAADALLAEIRAAKRIKEQSHALLSVSHAGTFHWHAPTRRFECDDNLATLLHVPSARELELDTLFARIHEDDRAPLRERWDRCAARGEAFDLDVRVPEPTGSPRWIGVSARSFVCEPLGPRCVVGACADVTAMWRTSEAELLLGLAENVPQLVWVASADGRIEYANRRWTECLGHRLPHDVAFVSTLHLDDRRAVAARWSEASAERAHLHVDARILCGEGSARWFSIHAVPLLDRDQVIARWVGTCTPFDDADRSAFPSTKRRRRRRATSRPSPA